MLCRIKSIIKTEANKYGRTCSIESVRLPASTSDDDFRAPADFMKVSEEMTAAAADASPGAIDAERRVRLPVARTAIGMDWV